MLPSRLALRQERGDPFAEVVCALQAILLSALVVRAVKRGEPALIDVGHRLEPEGVRKIIDFMSAHESFGSLEEAAENRPKRLFSKNTGACEAA